jgi:hypothetical protein
MTIETAIALATTAGSLVSWGLAQARSVGRIEGRLDKSATDQGRRIGDLEERVKALETKLLDAAGPKVG